MAQKESPTPMPFIPEEVWTQILFKLKDAADYRNCTRVSKSWQEILHPFRDWWLTRGIVQIVLPFLSRKEFLDLRLVNKDWKSQVDYYLANNFVHRPHEANQSPSSTEGLRDIAITGHLKRLELETTNFHNAESMTSFQDIMSPENGNPFLGRSISISYPEECEEYNFFQFLKAFGSKVWHMKIVMLALPMAFAKKLENCLKFTPNLRSLEVAGSATYNPGGTSFNDTSTNKIEGPWVFSNFSSYLESHEPPRLAHLESIQSSLWPDCVEKQITAWLMKPILGQLKRLNLSRFSISASITCACDFDFCLLTELSVVIHDNQQLKDLSRLSSPLKRLCLLIESLSDVGVNAVSDTISVFGESLLVFALHISEEFDLSYDHIIFKSNSPGEIDFFPPVKLPKLITLELTNCLTLSKNLICSETLQNKLQNFHVYYSTTQFVHYREEIEKLEQLLAGRQSTGRLDLLDSKIWRKFKNLKKITLENDETQIQICTREQVQYFQRLISLV